MAIAFLFQRPMPYAPLQRLQGALANARRAGRIPDVLLALEHQPSITVPSPAARAHLRATAAHLRARGIALATTTRGGDITYHAPGQWVLYPILRLEPAEADLHAYVERLEEIAIRAAAAFGVDAYRRRGRTGAWTEAGKLAAIGVRVRGWVTCHGLSFNADLDLDGFDAIVPCGLHGERVTSLRAILGATAPDRLAVRAALLRGAAEVLERPFAPRAIPGGRVPTFRSLFPT